MRKIFPVYFIFLLSSCAIQEYSTSESESLKEATVGVPYFNQIKLSRGVALSYDMYGGQTIAGDFHPDSMGLYIQYCDKDKINNCMQIVGIPKKTGIAKIKIHGGLGSGILSTLGEFEKIYTIIIKDPEGSS